jgi:sporulation protein YlmC with PRC-barrel domain
MPRTASILLTCLLATVMGTASAQVQAPTQEEIIQELIGAPVFSSDGQEVGVVSDVATAADGQISVVSMKSARFLGIGEAEVSLPDGSFTALRGAIVLGLPADGVEGLLPGSTAQP